MATAQPSKEVTTVQVGSVSFGWYSDAEVRSVDEQCTALPVQSWLPVSSDMFLEVAACLGG